MILGVNALRIKNIKTNEGSQIDVAGVFIAIGHTPNTSIFAGQLEMENGYIKVKSGLAGDATQTNIKRSICCWRFRRIIFINKL